MERGLASRIDYAFLRADPLATVAALRQAIANTLGHGFRSLCLPPVLAGTAKKNYPELRVCAVVGYPLGTDSLAAKIFAMQELIEQGVDEVDVVLDLFALVNSNWRKLEQEALQLGLLGKHNDVFVKAIIETPILSDEQIRSAAELLMQSPIPCVKTSTGYHREATTLEQVRLLHDVAGRQLRIKAAGGIRSLHDCRAFIDAGADILGTSQAMAIMQEATAKV